jgi:hypothetical protein
VFDPEFGIDLLAGTGFFGMGYGRIFGIRDGIDSRDFRDGTGFEKKFTFVPLQFFSKIFEKNIKGDQGDFFQFFQKLIKKITLLSSRNFFCTAGYLKKFNPFLAEFQIFSKKIFL